MNKKEIQQLNNNLNNITNQNLSIKSSNDDFMEFDFAMCHGYYSYCC
jgi:hypothetical protein